MNINRFFLKNLNSFIFVISLFLSLLIYFENLYKKDIYIFNFENLNFVNIEKKFLDENFYKENKLKKNLENEKIFKQILTGEISRYLKKYYLFTNTLSNHVRYDPNDLDIFVLNYMTENKIDFKKQFFF